MRGGNSALGFGSVGPVTYNANAGSNITLNNSATLGGAPTGPVPTVNVNPGAAVTAMDQSSLGVAMVSLAGPPFPGPPLPPGLNLFGLGSAANASVFANNLASVNFNENSQAQNATLTAGVNSVVNFNNNAAPQNATINLIDPTATVNFSQSTEQTLARSLTGVGTTNVSAPMLNIVSNNATYAGNTFVQPTANLNVMNALGGNITVRNDGVLRGTGMATNVHLLAAGRIRPGASIGTFTITGDLVQDPNSIYEVQVDNAGNASRINVGGTATTTGALVEVELINGAQLSPNTTETVTILHANGGRIGQYAAVTSNAMITPTLSYGPNDVFLTIANTFSIMGRT